MATRVRGSAARAAALLDRVGRGDFAPAFALVSVSASRGRSVPPLPRVAANPSHACEWAAVSGRRCPSPRRPNDQRVGHLPPSARLPTSLALRSSSAPALPHVRGRVAIRRRQGAVVRGIHEQGPELVRPIEIGNRDANDQTTREDPPMSRRRARRIGGRRLDTTSRISCERARCRSRTARTVPLRSTSLRIDPRANRSRRAHPLRARALQHRGSPTPLAASQENEPPRLTPPRTPCSHAIVLPCPGE
jgi:hypothetical protein